MQKGAGGGGREKQSTVERQGIKKPKLRYEPHVDTTGRKFKITVINILLMLVGKVDKMHGQMEHFSTEMKTVRNNQTEMLKVRKTTVVDEECFDRLISRMDTDEDRISEAEGRWIEISQPETHETRWQVREERVEFNS